jgi:hypothetical protein
MVITTEFAGQKTVRPEERFMKKLLRDRCCLAVLRFFVTHPNSRFSKLAVIHAIDDDGGRLGVERALAYLGGEGILKMNTEDSICFYLLTGDEPIRQLVLDMANLDWRQWQMILEY